jgi:hypothetical protein
MTLAIFAPFLHVHHILGCTFLLHQTLSPCKLTKQLRTVSMILKNPNKLYRKTAVLSDIMPCSLAEVF